MKNNFLLLSLGLVATFAYTQMKVHRAPGTAVVQVEKINTDELNRLHKMLKSEVVSSTETKTKVTKSVTGIDTFKSKVEDLYTFLKTNQVLFRYDFINTMKPFADRAKLLGNSELPVFNEELNNAIERVQKRVETIRIDAPVKTEIFEKLASLKNTVQISETVITVHPKRNNNNALITNIEESLKKIKTTQPVKVEVQGYDQYPDPVFLASFWALLLVASIALSMKKKNSASESSATATVEEEDKINPTLKRVLSELEYPLFMIDSNLDVVWKNKRSDELDLSTKSIQEMLASRETSESMNLGGKDYNLTFTELAYKSGKVNHLVQCRPNIVTSRQFDHVIDATEVTAYLESLSHETEVSFGDLNQTTAHMAVKLGYLFKVSGKYLDIDFKKDLSDCFIEKVRLEKVVKEFIMSCHHMIKDQADVEGIYLRTDEKGNKFSVSCFLPNYKIDALGTNPLARDFLRRFSVLEARYSSCNPSVDFRIIEDADVRGLDISVYFENQSELETMMSNASASA